jgi:NADPH:quinone reductase-like Zn-dependent oxidoreductase
MKAFVCTRYGPPGVLRLDDVAQPAPAADELRVRVRATSVTAADYRIRGLQVPFGFGLPMRLMLGFTKPRIPVLGMNFSGVVERVGAEVTRFRPGDPVFGTTGMRFGACAEYLCIAQDGLVAKIPANRTDEEAAAFPFGALTANYFLRTKGDVRSGRHVLIYGASGAVGTAAVQLAKHFGATVTGVCGTSNLELVRALGADRVVDYTREDFTAHGGAYDIIFDTVGKAPLARSLEVLKPDGRLLLASAGLPQYARLLWNAMTGGKRAIAGMATENKDDFDALTRLFAAGKLNPVIDRSYPFASLPEAHAYAEQGHKKGNVVNTFGHETEH